MGSVPQLGDDKCGQLLWVGEVRVLLHDRVDHIGWEDVAEVAVGLVLVFGDGVALLLVQWVPACGLVRWKRRWGVPGRTPDLLHLLRHAAHHDALAAGHESATAARP